MTNAVPELCDISTGMTVMVSEFTLIERYLTRPTRHTVLAGGDDGALIAARTGMQIVVASDMLVEGTHYFADTPPHDLGWKTLAVNVSDIAAMGAQPRWALLALALPGSDEAWLAAFADGLHACAGAFDVDLIGGDTTRGPRNQCVTILGEVPVGAAVLRSGARAGDEIWLSGEPGHAHLGLLNLRGEFSPVSPAARSRCLGALQRPQPRVALGLALRGLASAMLDVSDGVLADLRHILRASGVGAELALDALPLAPLRACGASPMLAREALLSGGDDYELLWTAPPARHADILACALSSDVAAHCIGRIVAAADVLIVRQADGQPVPLKRLGYDHFA